MLRQHLLAGNIRRVARGVFAAVPPHGDAHNWAVDRFLAASKLKPDAVIAYHSALELHGVAYTDAPDVHAISKGEPTVFETPQFSCRFVKWPAGLVATRDLTTVDRAGLTVRVTTLERTLADVFDRPDLAGGAEELFDSLALVERVKADELVRQARSLKNAAAAGALGWWLERERERLGVPATALASLRALKPKHPQYVLSARPGSAKSVSAWNILVPLALISPTFEGA
jgi:predicted transcriptional regulator of viral defense system